MIRSRRRVVLWIASVFLFSSACDAGTSAPEPFGSPTAEARSLAGVISSSLSGGDVRVELRVRARMPEAFDDGLPNRQFRGKGLLDHEEDVAAVTYRLGPVPNAAGFFGQVDGKTSVFYTQDGFTLSFPVLADLLPGPVTWARYELDDFSKARVRKLGIGQLREVGLSDPRLATALLSAGPEALTGGVPRVLGSGESVTVYRFEADVEAASATAGHNVGAQLDELSEQLGVTEVPVELMVDVEHRVRRLSYEMSYPPAPDSRPVRLEVRMDFVELGVEGGLTPPPDATVVDYENYVEGVEL